MIAKSNRERHTIYMVVWFLTYLEVKTKRSVHNIPHRKIMTGWNAKVVPKRCSLYCDDSYNTFKIQVVINWIRPLNEKHIHHIMTQEFQTSMYHIATIWKHNDSISRVFLMADMLNECVGMSFVPLFRLESRAGCWFRHTFPPHLFLCFTV